MALAKKQPPMPTVMGKPFAPKKKNPLAKPFKSKDSSAVADAGSLPEVKSKRPIMGL